MKDTIGLSLSVITGTDKIRLAFFLLFFFGIDEFCVYEIFRCR